MRLHRLFRLGDAPVERDVDDEIASHLAIRTEQLIRAGETPERARELAVARFGDVERARMSLYASARAKSGRLRRFDVISGLKRDALLVWRQARRAPLGTALTLATLAIAIGLTTAMFAVVDHVLLRPLPFVSPERLVFFQSIDSAAQPIGYVSSDTWLDLDARNTSLEASAIHRPFDTPVSAGGVAARVPLQLVTSRFFDVLRPPMVAGRGFAADDAGRRAVVVSETFWRTRLNGRRINNSFVRVQGEEYAVVGVVAAGAEYPTGTQVWLPFRPRFVGGSARNNVSYEGVARLRAGSTIERARDDLSRVALAIQAAEPESRYTHGVALQGLQAHDVTEVRLYLRMLMGAVGFVLLVACVNIAGVNFSRARARMQEVAIRMALGAGRTRVMLQLITEQVLLTLLGGALGVVLAAAALSFVKTHAADLLPRTGGISLDARVLLFAFAVSLTAGVLAALAPTWRAAGAAPRELMGARVVSDRGSRASGNAVVAIEIAVAVLLLSCGALLVRSFQSLTSRELGFDPDGVVAVHVILDSPAWREPARARSFWDDIVTRARTIPGVTAVGLSNTVPTSTAGPGFIEVDGLADRNAGAGYRVVDTAYFRTLRVQVKQGRTFNAADRAGVNRGVVINEAMAAKYWPGVSPIGRRVRALTWESLNGAEPQWLTVIGVVRNIRHWGYEEPAEPEMYVHNRDIPAVARAMFVTLRTTRATEAAVKAAIAAEIRKIDAEVAPDIATLDERLGGMLTERRLAMIAITIFALIALVLSAIGIYALLAFTVGQRTREIGLRVALGSSAREIAVMIFSGVARLFVVGALAGLLAAVWVTRLVGALLVDVTRGDPVSYLGALLLIAIAAAAASAVPIRRALQIDPVKALRTE